ncbi:hypothetical protein [Cesiribacter sp. SM1]|uniref:hypothetical protein n=1 Tax=Cesiribacter sp. SM1 TaxID=2861196 RepID=UPI001CD34042|nr:hypothetical protein [Cesiribacter sp. SM1]
MSTELTETACLLYPGKFRTSLGYSENPIHKRLARLTDVQNLVKKLGMGRKRMSQSRWNNSVLAQQCFYQVGEGWCFENIPYKKVSLFEQATLFEALNHL